MRLGNPNVSIDGRLEEEGKWIDFPTIWWRDENTPMRALLRGAHSRRHQAYRNKRLKGLTPEQREEQAFEIMADFAIDLTAGWEGVFDENGDEVRYDQNMCRAVLSNYENRRVVDFIYRTTDDLANYNVIRREQLEKN